MKRTLLSLWLMMAAVAMGFGATIEELRTPNVSGLTINEQEMEALRFLYAYMPLADVTD